MTNLEQLKEEIKAEILAEMKSKKIPMPKPVVPHRLYSAKLAELIEKHKMNNFKGYISNMINTATKELLNLESVHHLKEEDVQEALDLAEDIFNVIDRHKQLKSMQSMQEKLN